MKDDLRKLVEQELPKLAKSIIKDGLSIVPRYYSGGRKGSGNWFHESLVNTDMTPFFVGPRKKGDADGYLYHVIAKRLGNKPDHLAEILFYDINIIDIDDVDVGTLQDLGSKKEANFQVDEYYNGGSEAIEYNVNVSESKTTEEEKSFSASISAEYTREVKATAGIKLAEAEVTETLSLKAEASASGEWRKSDSLSETVDKKYTIPAKKHWVLTCEKSLKHIRQDVLVTGLLTCKIWINSHKWAATDFESIDDLKQHMRGLGNAGNVWGKFWRDRYHGKRVDDATLDAWPVPRLTLNIPMEGKRTRYSKAVVSESDYNG